jgi:hypothetical protein
LLIVKVFFHIHPSAELEETPVKAEPSPVRVVAATTPVTVTPVAVVSNFLELL